MTDKEKRDSGEYFICSEELRKELNECKDKCFIYNQIIPSDVDKRLEQLKSIIGSYKNKFIIEQPFMCDYGYNIKLGESFYANHNLIILDGAKVSFGDNVYVGPNCGFYTAYHSLDKIERDNGYEGAKPINVGNSVWFGGNVVVLPGVTIGNNVVIGAGSVVTKDIPDNVIAAGNPCKIIRNLK